ncbi:hypothetical protein BS50DRAFT_658174 [Corynespora cassiicola Philippines]|uniref:Uncharacterized protein n=1 Tax=Corynespora cassiicola Philippines TaxID=1448308 RepID=A0A2T2P3Q1_CORCC|nr:hypothetical protein BS50DRAFT_658174 [Corynespora cassiicola Philippines]
MSTSVSVLDAFDHLIPTYQVWMTDLNREESDENKKQNQPKVHPSGNTTKKQEPPPPRLLLTHETDHELTKKATDLLYVERKEPASRLKIEYVASVPGHLRAEADVSRFSDLYLVHPVSVALGAKFPQTEIEVWPEWHHEDVRVDCSFRSMKSTAGNPATSVAMAIEYKKAGYLEIDHFKEGFKSSLGGDQVPQLMKDTNSLTFLKQATAYAERYRTDFIALFDYRTLILLRFQKNRLAASTVFVEPESFCKALLGFAIIAGEAKGWE